MAIEGPLRELGIHDVFQLLDLSRKTGVLRVTSQLRRNHGTIHFEKGGVIAAEVRSNPHRLGELLLRAGKITEAELNLAQETQRRGDERRLGEILVAIDAISQRELERMVHLQVEEVIFEVMNWREGYFSFNEGPIGEVPAEALVRIPTEALMMEGARRIDEWSRIERQIPHLGVVPSLVLAEGTEEGELDLLATEWEVLAMIDGTVDLRLIAGTLGRSEFEVARTVFGLQSAGIVQVRDPVRESSSDADDLSGTLASVDGFLADGDVESARVEVEALVAAYPTDAEAHLAAAQVSLARDCAGDAERAARQALGLDPMLALAHQALGNALALQGKFHDAVEWWERWLSIARHDDTLATEREDVEAAIEAARTLDGVIRGGNGR